MPDAPPVTIVLLPTRSFMGPILVAASRSRRRTVGWSDGTAGDVDALPVDVPAVATHEERHDVGHVVGLADPAQRVAGRLVGERARSQVRELDAFAGGPV